MQLSKIEILNLWGKDEITLNFESKVTFLTGANGSGKSTLLNIIFDTLNLNTDKSSPSTSKHRFWSGKAEFDNKLILHAIILPDINDPESAFDNIHSELDGKFAHHQLAVLKQIEAIYENKATNTSIHHISYADDIAGEIFLKETNHLGEDLSATPLAFLFQEDRNSLHNIEKMNIDHSLTYWEHYKNSIDQRFFYLRNSVQIHESHINSNVMDLMRQTPDLSQLQNTEKYQALLSQTNEINDLISLLNQYFAASNKEIVRDEENKLTLKPLSSDLSISWHLLSRGEKTLIYLFFAVYLYKNKVSVFLLDEPEISLHVKWQDRLIKDLSALAPDNQFIIATHSPSLVQNGWLDHCLEISAV